MNDIEDVMPLPGASGALHTETLNPRETARKNADREKHGINVPGDATIFVQTFGCGHNVSDGEYMAGQLVDRGYRITDDFRQADCFLINSCTVKNPSEDHFVNLIKKAKDTGKPVVVAGCVPQGEPNGKEWADVSVIGVKQIHQVTEVVEAALNGNITRAMGESLIEPPSSSRRTNSAKARHVAVAPASVAGADALPKLDLPKVRRNRYIEIIPINVGCLNSCTYCKTKHARGDLQSWTIDEIVGRVCQVIAEGVYEIRLTSEDVGAYGIDIGTTIVALLQRISSVVEGTNVMIRVGMSNPPYLLRHVEDVARILQHKNFYEFVHIPVQSGSNAILDAMKREYTVEEFLQCVDGFRAVIPDISVATDIICAFPGEGDKEWQETMDLCRHVQFPILNMSRYYARRATPAAAMPQIRTDVAKKRTVELTEFYNSYATYSSLVGSRHWIALLESAHDKHHLVGHTKAYVQVLVDPKEANIGEYVLVEITAVTKYSVTGIVLERAPFHVNSSPKLTCEGIKKRKTNVLFSSQAVMSMCVVAGAVGVLAVLVWRQRK